MVAWIAVMVVIGTFCAAEFFRLDTKRFKLASRLACAGINAEETMASEFLLSRSVRQAVLLLAFLSPIYYEFPSWINGDKLAVVQANGSLVYYPWGKFESPLDWGDRGYASVYSDTEWSWSRTDFYVPVRSRSGKLGFVNYWLGLRVADPERHYGFESNRPGGVCHLRDEALELFKRFHAEYGGTALGTGAFDVGTEEGRKAFCAYAVSQYAEEFKSDGIAVECKIYFSPYDR